MTRRSNIHARPLPLALLVIALAFGSLVWAQDQGQQSPSAPAPNQQTFATPQLAAQALIKAAESYDVPALLAIFGPDGKDFVQSADPVRDKNIAQQFVDKAHEKNGVRVNGNTATMLVGKDSWPLPVPIVRTEGKWFFDTKAGRDEILYRRIGANELDAIEVCRGFVEAQQEYAANLHDDSKVHQYAQKIISSPGKQDGLFWKNADGSPGGPVSEAIARAIQEGYSDDPNKRTPFHGYYFKILTGQGADAPLGQLDYLVHGLMIGGFALVAAPADYKVTGVKTFIVSNYGVVYEKDLGPDSLKIAGGMTKFNPDKTWRPTNDELVTQR